MGVDWIVRVMYYGSKGLPDGFPVRLWSVVYFREDQGERHRTYVVTVSWSVPRVAERSKGGRCIIRRQCEDVTSDRVRVRVDVGKVRLSRSRRIGDVEQAQFRTLPQKLPTACN